MNMISKVVNKILVEIENLEIYSGDTRDEWRTTCRLQDRQQKQKCVCVCVCMLPSCGHVPVCVHESFSGVHEDEVLVCGLCFHCTVKENSDTYMCHQLRVSQEDYPPEVVVCQYS